MKKILILGVNSYIGSSFQKYIEENYDGQYEIHKVSLRGDAWKKDNWAEYDSILNVTGKAHADIGSLTEEEKQEYYAVNCDLACEAAQKALKDGAGQYIYLSSVIVYGDSSHGGEAVHITKDTKPAPSNFYGDSKWQAEQKLRALFADTTANDGKNNTSLAIVRPPMIYGKNSKGNFQMLVKLADKTPVFPNVKNERSMLYVENLAEFLRLLIERKSFGVFLPQNNSSVTTAQMVAAIAAAKGKKVRLCNWMNPLVALAKKIPGKIGGMAGKAFGSMVIDQSLSREEIDGYQRFGLGESVRRSV